MPNACRWVGWATLLPTLGIRSIAPAGVALLAVPVAVSVAVCAMMGHHGLCLPMRPLALAAAVLLYYTCCDRLTICVARDEMPPYSAEHCHISIGQVTNCLRNCCSDSDSVRHCQCQRATLAFLFYITGKYLLYE